MVFKTITEWIILLNAVVVVRLRGSSKIWMGWLNLFGLMVAHFKSEKNGKKEIIAHKSKCLYCYCLCDMSLSETIAISRRRRTKCLKIADGVRPNCEHIVSCNKNSLTVSLFINHYPKVFAHLSALCLLHIPLTFLWDRSFLLWALLNFFLYQCEFVL